jgi:hypothetical protein
MRVVFLSILSLLLLVACSGTTAPDSDGVQQTVSDPDSGVTLTSSIDADEIVIAERIWVHDRWTFPQGYSAEFIPRDWSASDWSVVQTIEDPMRIEGDGFVVERRVQIEPFLPDDYSIPPAQLVITQTDTDTPTTITTAPIAVSVLGVLPDEDDGALNPIADARVPNESEQGYTTLIVIAISFGVALIAAAVFLTLRRQSHEASGNSIYKELVAIRESKDSTQAFDRLARVFERLDPRLRTTSEFREMINACDRVRFGQSPQEANSTTAARMAQHALELLGHDSRGSAIGGEA